MRWPRGGRPGDDAKGGFLGGTHSVRPRIRAGRKPKHDTIIGGKRTRGGLMGQSPGGSEASCAGVRSPPLRGEAKRRREGLTGADPEMTRKAVFSEGRTPCVRFAWPNVCRGIPFSRDGRAGPGRPRGHARMEPIPFPRACGARRFGKLSHSDALSTVQRAVPL